MKPSLTRVLAVVGAALVLMIGGAVAYASIPAADGTITGCVLKSSGLVRIIDTAKESCRSTETTVPWNQVGQPGQNGQPGTNGTNGVSGYEIVTKDVTYIELSSSGDTRGVQQSVDCPGGKKVTGGGGSGSWSGNGGSGPGQGFLDVAESWPAPSTAFDASRWVVTFGKRDGTNLANGDRFTMRIYAVCVTAN